jgi:hypothetical protein
MPESSPPPPTEPGRDPDLVALEGFESEFADLEHELERVERRDGSAGGGAAVDASDGADAATA